MNFPPRFACGSVLLLVSFGYPQRGFRFENLQHGLYIEGFAAIMGRSEGAQPRMTPVATRMNVFWKYLN